MMEILSVDAAKAISDLHEADQAPSAQVQHAQIDKPEVSSGSHGETAGTNQRAEAQAKVLEGLQHDVGDLKTQVESIKNQVRMLCCVCVQKRHIVLRQDLMMRERRCMKTTKRRCKHCRACSRRAPRAMRASNIISPSTNGRMSRHMLLRLIRLLLNSAHLPQARTSRLHTLSSGMMSPRVLLRQVSTLLVTFKMNLRPSSLTMPSYLLLSEPRIPHPPPRRFRITRTRLAPLKGGHPTLPSSSLIYILPSLPLPPRPSLLPCTPHFLPSTLIALILLSLIIHTYTAPIAPTMTLPPLSPGNPICTSTIQLLLKSRPALPLPFTSSNLRITPLHHQSQVSTHHAIIQFPTHPSPFVTHHFLQTRTR